MTANPTRPGFAFCTTIALVVSVLYVLSSGPTRMAAVRDAYPPPQTSAGATILILRPLTISDWWLRAYAPLLWASRQPWGRSLHKYWLLFPVRNGVLIHEL